jgi:hypothetical protein
MACNGTPQRGELRFAPTREQSKSLNWEAATAALLKVFTKTFNMGEEEALV